MSIFRRRRGAADHDSSASAAPEAESAAPGVDDAYPETEYASPEHEHASPDVPAADDAPGDYADYPEDEAYGPGEYGPDQYDSGEYGPDSSPQAPHPQDSYPQTAVYAEEDLPAFAAVPYDEAHPDSPDGYGEPGDDFSGPGGEGEYRPPEDGDGGDADGRDDATDGPRPLLTAQNLRRSLILVALGSLAAAVITLVSTGNLDSVFGSSEESSVAEAGDAPLKTGSAEGPAFADATSGTCLTWEDQTNPEITQVDCAQPHLFEVVERVDLSTFPGSEFGPHAQVTDAQRYAMLRDTVCAPAANRYLNGKLDPSGRFTVGLIHPGEKGWSGGERTVLCGLQETGVDGTTFRPITGTVASQDQSRVHAPGTCLGIKNGLPTDPVDCADEHAVEVTGQVDLGQKFPDAWPPLEEQDKFLGDTCRKISEDYLGGPEALHNSTLTVYWNTQSLPSWLAGSRRVDCTVGFGKSEGSYAVLKGSAKGPFTIDGKPPAPQPLPPPGRTAPSPVPVPPGE